MHDSSFISFVHHSRKISVGEILLVIKTFSAFFPSFLKSTFNFKHSEKKDDLIAYVVPKLKAAKYVLM